MTRRSDLLRKLIDRVAIEHPRPAHFGGDELEEWPAGAEQAFAKRGLLVATTRATSTLCQGCERACHKPVRVRTKPRDGTPMAFIQCNEEPDHGRIPVRLEHIRRFRASFASVAQALTNILKLDVKQDAARRDGIRIGSTRGQYGPRDIVLVCADRRLTLKVGQQEQDLRDMTAWAGNEIWIDTDQIRRLANRKDRAAVVQSGREVSTSPPKDRVTTTARRNREIFDHAERLRRQSKNSKSWTRIAEEIARMPFIASPNDDLKPITPSRIRRILAMRPPA